MRDRVVAASFRMGVFVCPAGCDLARDVVCIGSPLVIGEPEIERIVTTLARALDSAVTRSESRIGSGARSSHESSKKP